MPRSLRRSAIPLIISLFVPLFASGAARAAAGSISPDGVWREVDRTLITRSIPAIGSEAQSAIHVYEIDAEVLTDLLRRVTEPGTLTRPAAVAVTLPLQDGTFEWFTIQSSPVFSAELSAEHPDILSFVAQGASDPTLTATLVQTPAGFYSFIRTAAGMVYMEPNGLGNTRQGISYTRAAVGGDPDFSCGVGLTGPVPLPGVETAPRPQGGNVAPSGATLSTYDLAVSATGEFTRFFDPISGTTNTLSQIAASVAAVNAIYMPEVAIRFVVVCNNVFTDPTTDPFTDSDNSGTSIGQNQTTTDANCGGSGGYDIGHVFHRRTGNGFSGLAGGTTCNNGNKAMGYSSVSNPVPATMIWVVDQLSHEMGHQFTADHTFNSDVTGCNGNRVGASAYEPGSGSTIMSYAAGTRCNFDFPGSNDAYFHGHSFDQITNHRDGGGACGVTSATGNTPPTVNAGSDHTIPRGTPFTLVASGSDADGDALTYCWEQFDLGSPGDLATNVNGPLFRSRPPTASPARTFPVMSDILAGNPTPTELLPLADRTIHFRCTVRDNRAAGGGVNNASIVLTVAGDPFVVTSPNGGETLHADCGTTVTWTVGGGSVAANVNILLSTNGGTTFPITLASNVPNDGSQDVTLPCTALTTQGRIMVAAAGNVFFDVSNANFTIKNDAPVATMDATGGDVGASCEFQAPYSATITDDCGVDANTLSVTASSLDGLATVGTPTVTLNVVSSTEVNISGTVLVSALTGCPASVRVSISGKDRCGATASASDDIQVTDTTPPTISVVLNRTSLWPPNHKLAAISAAVTIVDNCPNPGWVLKSVTSDEPENGLGDGDTAPDIVGADLGTADTELQLRSERQGTGDGRDYTLVYEVSDACGNAAQATAHVLVPKSMGAAALASDGFSPDGEEVIGRSAGMALIVLGAPPVEPGTVVETEPSDMVQAPRAAASGPSAGGFDPRQIDTRHVQLGNVDVVASPAAWRWLDANDDGELDAVFWFADADVQRVLEAGRAPDAGSIGLQIETRDHAHFLVPDIFALGIPVLLPTDVSTDLGAAALTARGAGSAASVAPAAALDEAARTPVLEPVRSTEFVGVHPNPTLEAATVRFQLATDLEVDLSVFDLRGARVRVLAQGRFAPGPHQTTWDGHDDAGHRLAHGLYLIRFAAGGQTQSRKVMLMN